MEKSMKKATLIVWVIIFGFIALVIFQNQTFFLAKNSFSLNLGITEEYHSPELPNAVVFIIFFFFGLIVTYLFSLSTRFKAKRTIKKLNSTIAAHMNELAELKSEINTLKGIETPADELGQTVSLDINAPRKTANDTTGNGSGGTSAKNNAGEVTSAPYDGNETGSAEIELKK